MPEDILFDLNAFGERGVELAQLAGNDEAAGRVETLSGTVIVRRLNGETANLAEGDEIFMGDTLEVSNGGSIGVLFADDTTVALGSGAEMIVDEMVYDPTGETGSMALSIADGVFSFVSGQISKTGNEAMVLNTPVATIGIRGTKGAGMAAPEGSENTITLMPEDDGQIGELVVRNDAGVQVLNQPGQSLAFKSRFEAPPPPTLMSPADMQAAYGAALNVMPPPPRRGRSGENGSTGDAQGDEDIKQVEDVEQIVEGEAVEEVTEGEDVPEEDLPVEDDLPVDDEIPLDEPDPLFMPVGGPLGEKEIGEPIVANDTGLNGDDPVFLNSGSDPEPVDLGIGFKDLGLTEPNGLLGGGDDVSVQEALAASDAGTTKTTQKVTEIVTQPTTTQSTALSGNNNLTGTASADVMVGGTGNDTLNGGAGNDTLYGDIQMGENWEYSGGALDTSKWTAMGGSSPAPAVYTGVGTQEVYSLNPNGSAIEAGVISVQRFTLVADMMFSYDAVRHANSGTPAASDQHLSVYLTTSLPDASFTDAADGLTTTLPHFFHSGTTTTGMETTFRVNSSTTSAITETADSGAWINYSFVIRSDGTVEYYKDNSLVGKSDAGFASAALGTDVSLVIAGRSVGTTNLVDNIRVTRDGDSTSLAPEGADTLNGGTGDDFLVGGHGDDTYEFSAGFGMDSIDDSAGTDTITFDESLFNITYSFVTDLNGAEIDEIDEAEIYNNGPDLVLSHTASDQVTILGHFGAGTPVETIKTLNGDTYYLSTTTTGGTNDDVIAGTTASDTLSGNAGNDFVYGHDGADWVYGNAGFDILGGGLGNDYLYGGTEGDVLLGDGGADNLLGEDGDDLLIGGAGNDTLTGGNGSDIFMFQNVDTLTDTITDFTAADDQLAFDGATFGLSSASFASADFDIISTAYDGTNANVAGAEIIYDSSSGNIYYDSDGSNTGSDTGYAVATVTGDAVTYADIEIVD